MKKTFITTSGMMGIIFLSIMQLNTYAISTKKSNFLKMIFYTGLLPGSALIAVSAMREQCRYMANEKLELSGWAIGIGSSIAASLIAYRAYIHYKHMMKNQDSSKEHKSYLIAFFSAVISAGLAIGLIDSVLEESDDFFDAFGLFFHSHIFLMMTVMVHQAVHSMPR